MKITSEYYDAQYFESDKYGPKILEYEGKTYEKYVYKKKSKWEEWIKISKIFKELFNPQSVLDVGCGCGSFLEWAFDVFDSVCGVDYSSWAVHNLINPKLREKIFQADARKLPFKAGSFDLVVCSDVLEHIYVQDVDWVLGELFRVSKQWVFLHIAVSDDYKRIYGEPKEYIYSGSPEDSFLEWNVFQEGGHVTVKPELWWLEKLKDYSVLDVNLIHVFRKKLNPIVNKEWGCIFIYRKK